MCACVYLLAKVVNSGPFIKKFPSHHKKIINIFLFVKDRVIFPFVVTTEGGFFGLG